MVNGTNMDSVFDNAINDEIEFDTMFDQEDDLIDAVEGFGESTDPLDNYVPKDAEGAFVEKVTIEAEVLDIDDILDSDDDEEPLENCTSVKKEDADITIDSIEEDIEKEAEDAERDMLRKEKNCSVKESFDDVENEDSDEELIDIAMGQEENDFAEEKYAYDVSDEDLIDIAMNN